MHHDLGFAPNPFFDWCSLACCKPKIRKRAKIDDVIVGLAGKSRDGLGRFYPQLIYWMQVGEALTFDEYWGDPRFARKRPSILGRKCRMVGDNTYRHDAKSGEWIFNKSMHYIPGVPQHFGSHVQVDTSVDRVLLSRRYTYWGNDGPALPDHLIAMFPPTSGERWNHPDPGLVLQLHQLIDIATPRQMVGEPADWDNSRYFKGFRMP